MSTGRVRVLKPTLLKWVRRPEKVAWWFRQYENTVPGDLIGDPPGEPSEDGFVWIQLTIPNQSKMRVQVPVTAVLIRHAFMRPWFPLPLLTQVEALADSIRVESEKSRLLLESFAADGIQPGNLTRHHAGHAIATNNRRASQLSQALGDQP